MNQTCGVIENADECLNEEKSPHGTNGSKLKHYAGCFKPEQKEEISEIEHPPKVDELSDLELK